MRRNNIKPTGLKGNEVNDRMLHLMGVDSLNETTEVSNIKLTKVGPDGNAYAIVKENNKYYIKKAKGFDNLVAENFNYIGGLQNKTDFAYNSYSKATRQLNLKFMSLAETYGGEVTDILKNDNLLSEHHPYKSDQKLSATKGMGDADEYVVDKKGKDLSYDAKEDKETSGDNVASKKAADEMEDVKLTENEIAIDEMITGESMDPVGKEDGDINNDGKEDSEDDYLGNRRLKIGKAISMEEAEDRLNDIVESLSEEERQELIEALKKKV